MKASTLPCGSLYVPLEDALRKLRERKTTRTALPANALEQKLAEHDYAVLFRQIATANFEVLRFASLAKLAGLIPIVVEYRMDRFTERNPAKRAWLQMRFPCEPGRQGGSNARVVQLVDTTKLSSPPLCELTTRWGRNVIEFHHQLARSVPSLRDVEWYDASDWFHLHGGKAQVYYPEFFTVFVSQAVLFESFPEQGYEADFTSRVMLPALLEVSSKHHARPLICRLDPAESEGDPMWLHYPRDLFDTALRLAGYKPKGGRIKWVRRLGLAPQMRSHQGIRKTPSA